MRTFNSDASEAIRTFGDVFAREYPGISLSERQALAVYLYTIDPQSLSGTALYQSLYAAVRKTGDVPKRFCETMVREYWREVGRREHGCGDVVATAESP